MTCAAVPPLPPGLSMKPIAYPPVNYGTGAKAKLVKQGEYLVKLGDCIACHTDVKEGGKPFAGNFAVVTPFGTIYTPNLTSDKKYGIGKWTDKQFIHAVHDGVSPQGSFYYPAFPFPYFNKVTDKDLLAIRAYLNAIPAVPQLQKKNEMMFPFNWRFLQLGWRILFFYFQKTGPYQANPQQSAQWNRGAYIVQGLAHCGMCHTPMWNLISSKLPLGAAKQAYFLAGGRGEKLPAPNISGEGLKNISVDQVVDVFNKCELLGGGKLAGSMLEADLDSFRYLTQYDQRAIAIYIKTVKSKQLPKPKVDLSAGPGAAIYTQHCAACHATGAAGAPKFGDKTVWETRLKSLGLKKLYYNAIHGINAMPAKGMCASCTDKQIEQTVDYLLKAAEGGLANKDTPPNSLPEKPLTVAQGETIFHESCAICHANTHSSYGKAPQIGADQQAYWSTLIEDKGFAQVLIAASGPHHQLPSKERQRITDAQIKAAMKYMLQASKVPGNYNLW